MVVFVKLFATNFIEVHHRIFVAGSLFTRDLIIADQQYILEIRDH